PFVVPLCARANLRLECSGLAQRRLVLQSAGLAASGRSWRVVRHRGGENPAVGGVAPGACSRRPLSGSWPDPRAELGDQATGPAFIDERLLPSGQVESRSVAVAAFSGPCGCGVSAHSFGLAGAIDAGDALREVLWREFAADILSRRPAGARRSP